jgi:hypothetical protein
MMEEIALPSGAILKIQVAPFAVAKALYQAVLAEFKELKISIKDEHENLFKNIFCSAFSSAAIERCLEPCMARCTIDSLKIDKDTFEKIERRGDYVTACIEVAKANIVPFTKSLWQQFADISKTIESVQK